MDCLVRQGEQPFDLGCVDLPGLDGLALVREICILEERYAAEYSSRIIVVSASGHAQDVVGAFCSQADGYLHKPVIFARLFTLPHSLSVSLEESP